VWSLWETLDAEPFPPNSTEIVPVEVIGFGEAWRPAPAWMDTPQNTLLHALLSLRDRSEQEKRAWRAMFDYYVFGPAEKAAAHLPEAARGNLAPLDEDMARRLRAKLLERLNR